MAVTHIVFNEGKQKKRKRRRTFSTGSRRQIHVIGPTIEICFNIFNIL